MPSTTTEARPLTGPPVAGPPSPPPQAYWPPQPPPTPPYADDPRFDGYDVARAMAPTAPPPNRPPAGPAVRRPRWWPALAIVLVLLMLGGAGYAVGTRMTPTSDTATQAPTTITPPTSTPSTTPVRPKQTTPSTVPDDQSGTGTDPGTGSSGGSGSSGSSGSTGSTDEPVSAEWQAVAAKINPGVVNINTRVSNGEGAGTGMILTADGTILTNNHVIEGATTIVVTTVVDGKSYRATVVGADPSEDIAVIKLTGASGLTPIKLGDSDNVKIGDAIAGMGNAGGAGGLPKVAPGTVTDLDQQMTATDEQGNNAETLTGLIEVDAAIVPGDSGGPLVSEDAEVIGIDTAAASTNGQSTRRPGGSTSTNQGFAIPINHALEIAKQLEATGKGANGSTATATAYLGVQIVDTGNGAEVVGVQTDSPAETAGIDAGSVITALDGKPISTATALSSAIQAHKSGDSVSVAWTGSDGQSHTAKVTLG